MSCPYQPPPKKTQSVVGIGGRGWQDSIWHRKIGPEMRLLRVDDDDDDDDDDGKGGKQGEKYQ
jgi:hypothetical protein